MPFGHEIKIFSAIDKGMVIMSFLEIIEPGYNY